MQELRRKHGPAPFRPNPFKTEPPFPTLVSSIVGQQLSGKAAETIWKRLAAQFAIEPEVLYTARLEDLRAIGLSNAKARYVQDLSRFTQEGGLDGIESQSDDEVIRHLTQVNGIGVWTVQMFLMFGLGRPNVWPILDLGIRKGAEKLYGITERPGLEELGERFRPYRSHAAWYLWRVLEAD
ncbi:DNA-3-methyladenine glycosylase 2 family protein [uncultured Meiothermus sp.]|uniref:DNA-3-methyladenine glycosylase family protein n=1 Tax=uncultured Meiothermus sp. TaxID=157471 RepID=UPI00260EBEFE|nr:DNA-3-methyladenine glycosylase 2 family protein [uncultured Meiothermus sp.]